MNHLFSLRTLSVVLALALTACSPPKTAEETESASASATASAPVTPQNISAADQDLLKKAQGIFKPLPSTEESLKQSNLTDAHVKLGQQLWYEPRLSLADDISCNSCHGLNTYGVDNKPTSPGHKGQLGARNSPTAYNAFLSGSQFWDGRAADVEEQAKGPIINPVEMAMPDHAAVETKISQITGYVEQFKTVYADKGGKVNIDNIAHAIGAFERTLLTPSRWDNFLKGDANALNEQEKRGVKAFMDNGCIACHTGVNLGGDLFQKFGLVKGPYWDFIDSKKHDEGVFEVSKKEADKFVFRVPALRNVEKTAPYFHNGSVTDLAKAVDVMGQTQLGKNLSKAEIEDIVAFLKSTTGELPAAALVVPELPK